MPPLLDPPVLPSVAQRLVDANNATCLVLENTAMYTFSPSTSQWLPRPQYKCWRSGLTIRMHKPDTVKSSFAVRITGRHFTCSKSHLSVTATHTMTSDCVEAGLVCRLDSSGHDSGGLTTCVAKCPCGRHDCKRIAIYIPRKHDEWQLCEISVHSVNTKP